MPFSKWLNLWYLWICLLGYERLYLPVCIVADTPFYIKGDDLYNEKENCSETLSEFPSDKMDLMRF